MASFSLWEHLLSFISVSWIYRITLVSVRRETHLREQLVRGLVGLQGIRPKLHLQIVDRAGSLSHGPGQPRRQLECSPFPSLPPWGQVPGGQTGRRGQDPEGRTGRRGESESFFPYFCAAAIPVVLSQLSELRLLVWSELLFNLRQPTSFFESPVSSCKKQPPFLSVYFGSCF